MYTVSHHTDHMYMLYAINSNLSSYWRRIIYSIFEHLNFKIYKYHIVSTIYIINYMDTILNKLTIKIISISFIIKYYFIAIIYTFIFFILLRCSSINKNTKLWRTSSNT